jgi:hypothetical protein
MPWPTPKPWSNFATAPNSSIDNTNPVGVAAGCDLLILLFLRKKIAACGSSYKDFGATKRVGIQAAVEAAGRVGRPASTSCARIGLAMRRIFR